MQSNISIDDISKIIMDFSRMYDQFYDYDDQSITLTENGMIAVCKRIYSTTYCNVNIPNQTKQTFEWKFKCNRMKNDNYWGIGIDAVQNEPEYRYYFYNDTSKINYYYKANGDMWAHGAQNSKRTTAGWKKGDIVTLTYNGVDRKLWILINNELDENSILLVEDSEGGFRVAVYMGSYNDEIELLP